MSETTYNFKIVLLGEGAVGKTSLVLRYVNDQFNSKHISTLQASFMNKKLNIDNNRINLNIWDTAGQEKFHALGPIYYRQSNGAILVYDITDEDSFQKVKNWVKELKKILGNEIIIVIVGNKIDLEKDRKVLVETAKSYAESVGAKYFETSAKLNEGVEEVFLDLTRDMVEMYNQRQEMNANLQRSNSMRRRLVVDQSDETQPNETNTTRKCCA